MNAPEGICPGCGARRPHHRCRYDHLFDIVLAVVAARLAHLRVELRVVQEAAAQLLHHFAEQLAVHAVGMAAVDRGKTLRQPSRQGALLVGKLRQHLRVVILYRRRGGSAGGGAEPAEPCPHVSIHAAPVQVDVPHLGLGELEAVLGGQQERRQGFGVLPVVVEIGARPGGGIDLRHERLGAGRFVCGRRRTLVIGRGNGAVVGKRDRRGQNETKKRAADCAEHCDSKRGVESEGGDSITACGLLEEPAMA